MSQEDDVFVKHRDFWIGLREIVLAFVNLLETKLEIIPTTSQIRKEYKERLKRSEAITAPLEITEQ